MKNSICKSIYVLLIITGFHTAKAQDSLTFKLAYIAVKMDRPPLQTGDLLPTIENKIYNYDGNTLNLNDLKGKLVILHFWHQYCSYCVAQFRFIDSLQQQFKDKIAIIPVTFQSEASVEEFYRTRAKKGIPISLPSIVEDTLLRKYFPHAGDPHEVWIDASGTVRAITEYRRLTAEAVIAALDKNNYKLPQRKHQFSFDPFEPFLINNNGGPANAYVYKSMFSRYIDSIDNTGLIRQQDNSRTRLFLANAAALDMYRSVYAYMDTTLKLDMDYLNKRVVIETNDPGKFRYWPDETEGPQAYDDYLRNNVYCYELTLSPSFSIYQAYRCMAKDLDRFFGCSSGIESKKVKLLKLIVSGNMDMLKTKGGIATAKFVEESKTLTLKNQPVSDLALMFNIYFPLPLVIDKTAFTGKIDIELQVNNTSSVEEINKALSQKGLMLVAETESLPMLVLRTPKKETGK
jgi:thiol-disulfide isomerase/thioredoxin